MDTPEAVESAVKATTTASGVPERLSDIDTLAQIAQML